MRFLKGSNRKTPREKPASQHKVHFPRILSSEQITSRRISHTTHPMLRGSGCCFQGKIPLANSFRPVFPLRLQNSVMFSCEILKRKLHFWRKKEEKSLPTPAPLVPPPPPSSSTPPLKSVVVLQPARPLPFVRRCPQPATPRIRRMLVRNYAPWSRLGSAPWAAHTEECRWKSGGGIVSALTAPRTCAPLPCSPPSVPDLTGIPFSQ